MTGLLALGFLVGMRHALEADHLAAVATLVTRSRGVAAALAHGIAWGLGHTVTLFAVGALVILLDVALTERVAHGFEAAVGVMLVALGVDVIRRVRRGRLRARARHRVDGASEEPARDAEAGHDRSADGRARLPVRAMLIGLMHGLAGSAALILVTAGSAPTAAAGLGYMGLFGLGSMVGMALVSAAIAVPLHRYARPLTWMHDGLHGAVGAVSVGLGVMVLVGSGAAGLSAP